MKKIINTESHTLLQKALKFNVKLRREHLMESATYDTDTTLKYYLVSQRDGLFGVMVQRLQGEQLVEKESVTNLTYSVSEANRIVSLLSSNHVTPTTLVEVLDALDIVSAPDVNTDPTHPTSDQLIPEPRGPLNFSH